MAKRKEIKFQRRHDGLRGRQNGMEFWIWKDGLLDSGEKPEYFVVIFRKDKDPERVSTGGRRSFNLDGAMEFCQKIAAGEITVEGLLAEFEAEDMAQERAALQEVTEKAKKFHARLDLKYRDLLELEVLAHSLGEMGHNILLGYERGEGWPSGT